MGVPVKYGIFVHDPDGDMGYGRIVGPFAYGDEADAKAEAIGAEATAQGHAVECVVVPYMARNTGDPKIVAGVFG